MSLTIRQKSNAVDFPKPAELIEITGTSELQAFDRVILNTLYRHAHDSGDMAKAKPQWRIPLAELNVGSHNSLDRVRESLKRLMRLVATVTYTTDLSGTESEEILITGLFDYFIIPKKGSSAPILKFSISDPLQTILLRSNRWGRIKAEVVHAMTSKYSIALYELLRLRSNMNNCVETFTIDRFRDLLGVPPGAYEKGKDFRKYVIEPALLEVNGLSELGCKIELTRLHSRAPITKVVLAWWRKDGDEHLPAIQELNRSKLGRKARLKGEAETVSSQTDLEDFT